MQCNCNVIELFCKEIWKRNEFLSLQGIKCGFLMFPLFSLLLSLPSHFQPLNSSIFLKWHDFNKRTSGPCIWMFWNMILWLFFSQRLNSYLLKWSQSDLEEVEHEDEREGLIFYVLLLKTRFWNAHKNQHSAVTKFLLGKTMGI